MAVARWGRLRTELRSVRTRVLATTLAVLTVALLAVGGLTHYLRLVDLDESVQRELVQEAGELQRLAERGPLRPGPPSPTTWTPAPRNGSPTSAGSSTPS